jgi:hypothetical protein
MTRLLRALFIAAITAMDTCAAAVARPACVLLASSTVYSQRAESFAQALIRLDYSTRFLRRTQ